MTTTMDLARCQRLSWANSLQNTVQSTLFETLARKSIANVETEELTRLNQIEEELF